MRLHLALKRLVVELQRFGGPTAVPSGRFQGLQNHLLLQRIHALPQPTRFREIRNRRGLPMAGGAPYLSHKVQLAQGDVGMEHVLQLAHVARPGVVLHGIADAHGQVRP